MGWEGESRRYKWDGKENLEGIGGKGRRIMKVYVGREGESRRYRWDGKENLEGVGGLGRRI